MRRLILFRHGKAEGFGKAESDFHRELTEKGVEKSRRVAQFLKEKGIVPNLLISSPALRAGATARAALDAYGTTIRLEYQPAIYYENDVSGLQKIVRDISADTETAMMFGHNPGFSEYAEFLLDEFRIDIPKSGAAVIEIQKPWKDVDRGSGKLIMYESPKSVP